MAENIVEVVQRDLGFPALQKIDPNIQSIENNSSLSSVERLAQAGIPAVLAGFFKFTRTDKGCNYILAGGGSKPWIDSIFGDNKEVIVEKIAHYSAIPADEVAINMEDIARQAVIIIHKAPGEKPTAEKLRSYMSDQRHHILVYLPASLQLGELLNDSGMDDQTNKMEGPISNLVHNIENKFSGGGA
jgi:hypothetical protein